MPEAKGREALPADGMRAGEEREIESVVHLERLAVSDKLGGANREGDDSEVLRLLCPANR